MHPEDRIKCRKCDLVLATQAAKSCQLAACPQLNKDVAIRSGNPVTILTPSQELARAGILSYEELARFIAATMAETLEGKLDVEKARTIATFARQMFDILKADYGR